ncbi:hypothetical protein ABT234_01570 [Streptomyces sp. NPDC001586]|uniref:hypothetical protein n=1 Tax=unclassified Streptomyces TaxID=2593676 RepID=UPI003334494B
MTRDEYEAQQQRLDTDIEDARQALSQAQKRFDDLCNNSRNLHLEWQEQQRHQKENSP